MKTLITLMLVLVVGVAGAAAQQDVCYGWEDGSDVISSYLPEHLFAESSDTQAFEGGLSLEVWETGGTGTPQAYVAWITGLAVGDVVAASIMTLDLIEGNPSLRLWGHWTTPDGTIDDYAGSAGGNNTYSGGEGWVELSWEWTVPADKDGHGLVVEIRPYNGTPWTGSNWVDHLCVTAPTGTSIYFPSGLVGSEVESWTGVKALFR